MSTSSSDKSQSEEEIITPQSVNEMSEKLPPVSVAIPQPPRPTSSVSDKWKHALDSGSASKEEVETIRKEISIQENILLSLQSENESLLYEKKQLQQRIKDLEERNANLEAKYSIQMSAKGFSFSSVDEKDNTIKSLRLTIEELKHSVQEAERIKSTMQNQIQKQKMSVTERSGSGEGKSPNPHPTLNSQAHQYRLVESLNKKIESQNTEIERLRERCAFLERDEKVNQGHQKTKSISEQTSSENAELSMQVERLKLRIDQLEGALVEKDKCAEVAVGKLKTESLKIKTYYENAIKSIIANQGSSTHESKAIFVGKNECVVENKELKERIFALEEKLRNSLPANQYSHLPEKVEALTEDLKKARREIDSLLFKLQAKDEEIVSVRTSAKDELVSRLESLRNQHNSEITKLQEQHDREIKRFLTARINKDFSEKLKKQWLKLHEDHPEKFLSSVVDRLTFLEKYCAQKDVEMEVNINQILRVSEMENKVEKQKAEMIIEQKNIQIQEFQYHLESLMRTVRFLRANSQISLVS